MRTVLLSCLGILLMVWLLVGCSGSDNPATPPEPTVTGLTCVECHTSQEDLMALATEDPEPSGESGEG